MSGLVVDASVAAAWLLSDEKSPLGDVALARVATMEGYSAPAQ